ncbi:hypothetical protein J0H33_10675 [bacterium]|nr:hypothetical protein [bacterium]
MDTFRAVTGRLDWPVRFTWWVVFLVVANIAAFGALLAPKAHADHSFQSGTCYVTPEMCQNGYNGGLFYFRVDEFWASPSSIKANAQIGLHAAMSAWSSVAGPQLFRTSTDSNTPANYIFAQEFPAYQPTDPNIVSQLYSNAAITLNHGWWGSSYQYYGISGSTIMGVARCS